MTNKMHEETFDYIPANEPHYRLIDENGRVRKYAFHKKAFGHIPVRWHVVEHRQELIEDDHDDYAA